MRIQHKKQYNNIYNHLFLFRMNLLGLLLLLFTLDGCQFLFFCYKFYYSFCCWDFSDGYKKKSYIILGIWLCVAQKKRRKNNKDWTEILYIQMEFYFIFMNINHKSFPYQPGKCSMLNYYIDIFGEPKKKHF